MEGSQREKEMKDRWDRTALSRSRFECASGRCSNRQLRSDAANSNEQY